MDASGSGSVNLRGSRYTLTALAAGINAITPLPAHTASCRSISFSPDGTLSRDGRGSGCDQALVGAEL